MTRRHLSDRTSGHQLISSKTNTAECPLRRTTQCTTNGAAACHSFGLLQTRLPKYASVGGSTLLENSPLSAYSVPAFFQSFTAQSLSSVQIESRSIFESPAPTASIPCT